MNIGKIILAVAISVVSFFSASAAGRHGLITLKTGEQIEAPEVWFTGGQAIYLMSSKDKKVVIEDSEIDYVQYYDEEKKDFGDKEYSEYMITSYEFLKENQDLLMTVFIVSGLEVTQGTYDIKVEVADGEKCERCWMYSTTVGEDKENPTICHRCSENLK